MKKVFLTALFAVGALFNGTAQNAKQPIAGTNATINPLDGFTNIFISDVTKVYQNGYNYNDGGLLLFNINHDGGGLTMGLTNVTGKIENSTTSIPVNVQVMYNNDKNTIYTITGSNLYLNKGVVWLGATDGKVYGARTATTIHFRIVDPNDNSVVVYKVTLQNPDKIFETIINTQLGFEEQDPFGTDGGTKDGGNTKDPFGGTKNVEALDVEKYILEYQPTLINPFNLREFLGVFVSDAQVNYGLDFSYIYDYKIDLEFSTTGFDRLESETIAYTDAFGDDKRVHIVVNAARWNDASPIKRLMIFYHELGHDILNLDHIADEGPLMSVYAPSDISIENFIELRHEMFNDYTLQN